MSKLGYKDIGMPKEKKLYIRKNAITTINPQLDINVLTLSNWLREPTQSPRMEGKGKTTKIHNALIS